jgi:hypothetical protein
VLVLCESAVLGQHDLSEWSTMGKRLLTKGSHALSKVGSAGHEGEGSKNVLHDSHGDGNEGTLRAKISEM